MATRFVTTPAIGSRNDSGQIVYADLMIGSHSLARIGADLGCGSTKGLFTSFVVSLRLTCCQLFQHLANAEDPTNTRRVLSRSGIERVICVFLGPSLSPDQRSELATSVAPLRVLVAASPDAGLTTRLKPKQSRQWILASLSFLPHVSRVFTALVIAQAVSW
jgi:hypothetical protein